MGALISAARAAFCTSRGPFAHLRKNPITLASSRLCHRDVRNERHEFVTFLEWRELNSISLEVFDFSLISLDKNVNKNLVHNGMYWD